jgi:hypothetical protein
MSTKFSGTDALDPYRFRSVSEPSIATSTSNADFADLVAVAPERSSAEVDVFGAGLNVAASLSTAGTGFGFVLVLDLDCFDMEVAEVTVAFDS